MLVTHLDYILKQKTTYRMSLCRMSYIFLLHKFTAITNIWHILYTNIKQSNKHKISQIDPER